MDSYRPSRTYGLARLLCGRGSSEPTPGWTRARRPGSDRGATGCACGCGAVMPRVATSSTTPMAVEEGEVVLDAVHRVQATQAGDLAVRWQMCMTRLSALPPRAVHGDTASHGPDDPRSGHRRVRQLPEPSRSRRLPPPASLAPGEYRMAQADVQHSQEFRKCIKCWLGQDVCHAIRDHEDNKPSYSGPRFLSATPSWTCTRWTPLTAGLLPELHGLGLCNISLAPRPILPGPSMATVGMSLLLLHCL